MPYLPTAQSFLEQSRLLISARPTTTKITTKYTLSKPSTKRKSIKPTTKPEYPTLEDVRNQDAQNQPPVATLTLRTFDPVSGTCLKYTTDKAAEVGRLVAALSDCGRIMAALPDREEGDMKADETMKEEPDSKPVKEESGSKTVKDEPNSKTMDMHGIPLAKSTAKDAKGGQGKGGSGGGGGKKKKGKK